MKNEEKHQVNEVVKHYEEECYINKELSTDVVKEWLNEQMKSISDGVFCQNIQDRIAEIDSNWLVQTDTAKISILRA